MWRLPLYFVLVTLIVAQSMHNQESKVYILMAKKYQQGVFLTRLYRNTDELAPGWQQVDGENNRPGEMSYFSAYTNRLNDTLNKRITVCDYYGSSLITDGNDCSSLEGSASAVFTFYASDVKIERSRRITFVVCLDRLSNISYSAVSTHVAYCRGRDVVRRSGHFYASVGHQLCKTPKFPIDSKLIIADKTYDSPVRVVSVTYQCQIGFKIEGRSRTRHCYPHGIWNIAAPRCTAISCGAPSIQNGRPTGNKFNFPERTSFKCDVGYTLSPPDAAIDCMATGKWDGTFGECKPVSCGTPPSVPNGHVIGFIHTYPQTLSVVCEVGYELVSSSATFKCMHFGRWIGSSEACQVTTCRDPGVPANGRRTGDDFTYGSTVQFDCDEGYTLVGQRSLTCGNGIWIGFMPICQAST